MGVNRFAGLPNVNIVASFGWLERESAGATCAAVQFESPRAC